MKFGSRRSQIAQQVKLAGAKALLPQLQETIDYLWFEFGTDVFPNGKPVITQPNRILGHRADKAKQLIEGAERLHAASRGRKGKKQRKASPPTGDTVTIAQAAEVIGVTPSRVRQWIEQGKLKSLKNDEGRMALKTKDVHKFAAERNGVPLHGAEATETHEQTH